MTSPLVSIIVPVYKVEKYIRRCALSLFGQTYDNLELIFVDDGSPDRSVEILEEIAASFPGRNCRIVRKANEGQSYARRDAIAISTGEYLMFVDSDDWIEADAVARLVASAVSSGADMVTFGFWKEYPGRSKLDLEKDANVASPETFIRNLYTYKAYGYICTKFYRRSLCTDLYTARYPMHEDIIFNTQAISKAGRIQNLKEGLYHYDRTVETSSTRAPRRIRRSRSARNMLDFLVFSGNSLDPWIRKRILRRAFKTAVFYDHKLFKDYPNLLKLI